MKFIGSDHHPGLNWPYCRKSNRFHIPNHHILSFKAVQIPAAGIQGKQDNENKKTGKMQESQSGQPGIATQNFRRC